MPTRYSPVRHSVTKASFRRIPSRCFVRLACVKHAASVHPEPGSNSRYKCLSRSSQPLADLSRYCLLSFRSLLNNSLEFSGIVVYCSVIMVLFAVRNSFISLSHLFLSVKHFFRLFSSRRAPVGSSASSSPDEAFLVYHSIWSLSSTFFISFRRPCNPMPVFAFRKAGAFQSVSAAFISGTCYILSPPLINVNTFFIFFDFFCIFQNPLNVHIFLFNLNNKRESAETICGLPPFL